jgi:hypothetical protein
MRPMTDTHGLPPLLGPRTGTTPLAGATLFYTGTDRRPDLFLTAQVLIEDLRAEGWQMSGLRISEQVLRVRLPGLELALARSDQPLPADSLRGLCRPLSMRDLGHDDLSDAPDPVGASPLSDLGQIRAARALRQHQAALGVLLRRRGSQGPDDLDAALLTILRGVAEAAPPALVLWQRTGVVMTRAEFLASTPADMARPGDPARRVLPATLRERPLCDLRHSLPPPPEDGAHLGRRARAARRSGGRMFGRAETGGVLLPRIDAAISGVAAALRAKDAPGPTDETPGTPRRVPVLLLIATLWMLLLPGSTGPYDVLAR